VYGKSRCRKTIESDEDRVQVGWVGKDSRIKEKGKAK
jgi:hypothetical protein